MTNNIKNEKGIALITLVITVILLVIVTSVLAINSYSSLEVAKLTKLQNDIEILNDRVAAYFVRTGEIPVFKEEYSMTKTELRAVLNDMSINDGEMYYTIDLELLEKPTLNFGDGYLKLTNDRYIINEESHVIYYLKGVVHDGNEYHTVGKNPAVT